MSWNARWKWSAGAVAGLAMALSLAVGPRRVEAGSKPDPKDLMDRSDKRHRIPGEHLRARMVLQNEGGDRRTLQYESWVVQDDEKGDKMRIEFSAPADVRGTVLLRVEDPDTKTDRQWLYLPAFHRTRRLGEADLGDRFVGSDIFFEDMKRRYVEDYSYKLVGEDTIDGKPCWVIESRPFSERVKRESPYGKARLWLRKDILFVVKSYQFDRQGRPLKEMRVKSLRRVAGRAWRADRVEIVDVQRHHRTVVVVERRDLPRSIPDELFSKHRLGSR